MFAKVVNFLSIALGLILTILLSGTLMSRLCKLNSGRRRRGWPSKRHFDLALCHWADIYYRVEKARVFKDRFPLYDGTLFSYTLCKDYTHSKDYTGAGSGFQREKRKEEEKKQRVWVPINSFISSMLGFGVPQVHGQGCWILT